MINDDKDDDLDISITPTLMPPSLHGRVQTEEETGSLLPPSGFLGSTPFKPFKPYHSPTGLGQPPSNSTIPLLPLQILPQTQVSHPIWIMFWGVAQNKKPWLEVKSNYCFLWNTLSDNFQKEKFFWAFLVVGLFLRTGRDTGQHQLNYVCFPGMRASKIIQKANASRYLTNLSMRVILFVPF